MLAVSNVKPRWALADGTLALAVSLVGPLMPGPAAGWSLRDGELSSLPDDGQP